MRITLPLMAATLLSGAALGQALSSGPAIPPPAPSGPPLLSVPAPPMPETHKWVHIRGQADLDQLRDTNFAHYLRAREILAAANEICQPAASGVTRTYPARFAADYLSCSGWMVSNPPKTTLMFHLDDVGYIAVVSVTLSNARLVPVQAQAGIAK
jgi:hypothetical protein